VTSAHCYSIIRKIINDKYPLERAIIEEQYGVLDHLEVTHPLILTPEQMLEALKCNQLKTIENLLLVCQQLPIDIIPYLLDETYQLAHQQNLMELLPIINELSSKYI
jgi:hypothetical protein